MNSEFRSSELRSKILEHMIYGKSTVLDSQKNTIVELVGTWTGDLGVSDHLWTFFFGAELSGGSRELGRARQKYNSPARLKHG